MRERNLYLQKCRQIEEMGERIEWGGADDDNSEGIISQDESDDNKLLQEVYDILYMEK